MLKLTSLILSLLLLAGCVHTISINPELAHNVSPMVSKPIPKRIAFFLSEDMRNTTVTTPGGAGESVTYKPYQDLEVALIKMLRNSFVNVIRLTTPPDYDDLKRRDIHYVVTPSITTTSSSARLSVWAPTDFTLTLKFNLIDVTSGVLVSKEVVGEGKFDHATEMKFPLTASHGSEAARRATLDALVKIQQVLLNSSELRSDTRDPL